MRYIKSVVSVVSITLFFSDTFIQNTGDYYCRLIRLSDGLSRDTHPRKSYDQALMDGIKQALALLS